MRRGERKEGQFSCCGPPLARSWRWTANLELLALTLGSNNTIVSLMGNEIVIRPFLFAPDSKYQSHRARQSKPRAAFGDGQTFSLVSGGELPNTFSIY